jgi:hypothetical protein
MFTLIIFLYDEYTFSYTRQIDLGLHDRSSIPGRGKDFSSILCVQTDSGGHPASCTMGTGSPFPGGKARPGRDADHSPPSSAEFKKE